MWILIILLLILIFWLVHKFRKIPRLGNMTLVTGGIKTGKSTLSVYLCLRTYKRKVFNWKVKCFFIKIFKFLKIKKFANMDFPEQPLLYSNIPLNCEYVPLTKELLTRDKRFRYDSVIYVCESSLVADSMTYNDSDLNEQLLLFNKLVSHELRGGAIFYDTQSVLDNHYAIKRCLSSYLYVHHTIKVPFFLLMWVRELKYDENGTSVNTFNSDVEDDLKLIIVPKRVWKKFDCYCYSVLTDYLNTVEETIIPTSLKADNIVSFKDYKSLKKTADTVLKAHTDKASKKEIKKL